MKVPYMDLAAQHKPLHGDLLQAFQEVLESGSFAGGIHVEKFEREFASYCGAKHAVGVGSGTDALWLALDAAGVKPGDEVITVPMTFIATAEAISRAGATPVFVDICADSYTMDPALLEQAITPRTKAIIPVHLFGRMAEMEPILAIAQQSNLAVIEDAAQAHGAEYKGQRAGSFGVGAGFSFYPGKNLGALGDAGAMLTNSDEMAAKARLLRDHGQSRKYHHDLIGWNCRMDGIQAEILSVKLRGLDEGNARRREIAARYTETLAGYESLRLQQPPAASHSEVHHVYAVRVRERDRFIHALAERDVHCGIHYPVPVHLQGAYRHLGYEAGSFPVSENCAEEFVSLPIYPAMTDEQVEWVIKAVNATCEMRACA